MHLRFLLPVLLAGSGLAAPAQEGPRPALVCDAPRCDLGRVMKGGRVTHVFRLENRSPAALNLKDVRVSCDCTTAPLAVKTLAPGQGVDLPVTFDSSKFVGPVEKSVVVVSDDVVRPALVLELRATVVGRWTLEPATLAMGAVSRFQPFEARIRITRNDGKAPVVRGVKVHDGARFDAEVIPLPDPKVVEVILRLEPGLPAGPVRGKLLLALDDGEQPFREVPILGQLVDDVSAQPESLDLGSVLAGAAANTPLRVLLNRPGIDLTGIAVEPAWITGSAALRKELPGATTRPGYTIRFQVAEAAPVGPFHGRVRVKTSSPDQPEVIVAMSGTVTRAQP